MTPSNHVFFIYQGQTFNDELLFVDGEGDPIDLSAKSARMQVRAAIDSPTVILDLSSDDGDMVLGADGVLRFNVSAVTTAALQAGVYETQQWVYDAEFITPGAPPVVERVLTGAIVFVPEITR